MVDYYPVLARAVSGLQNNSAEARQELYARARAIIVEQMRQQDGGKLSPRSVREQAALENAIRRIEAESPPELPGEQSSLTKILAALETRETSRSSGKLGRAPVNGVKSRVAATPHKVAGPSLWKTARAGDLGALPNWLGGMFFGVTYTVAAVACVGLVYVRGSVLVAKGTIGYPLLLLATLALVCFFVALPRLVRKRLGEDRRPGAGTLRRRR